MTSQAPARFHSGVIVFMFLGDDKTTGHDPIGFMLANCCCLMCRNHLNGMLFILQGIPLYCLRIIDLILKIGELFEWCNSFCIFFLMKDATSTSTPASGQSDKQEAIRHSSLGSPVLAVFMGGPMLGSRD